MADFILESLRGGYNDTDPPNALQQDECVLAENVEFFLSTLGERRLGGVQFGLAGTGIVSSEEVVFATRHFPTKDETDNELWIVSIFPGAAVTVRRRTSAGVWSTVTPPAALSPTGPDVYEMQAQSFDGKLYLCAKLVGNVDRTLVWDGTQLRYVGLKEPVAPVVANEGSGTYITLRYFRVRYLQLNGTVVVRQSEPSPEVAFTPSGTGAGAQITRPVLLNEGETHWVVEASLDNANYYQITRLPIATTAYNDTTSAASGYSDLGDLSPDIGQYVPMPSARFIGVDDDRLILGGSFVNTENASLTQWTPTRNDPGVANSERIPQDTDNSLDLDSTEGGGLTGISSTANGSWYAFKFSRMYQMTRTGNSASAYAALTLSKSRGALFGSVCSGMDEYGRPCVYFWDPLGGPSRVGGGGLQQILGLRATTGRVNVSAAKVGIRGVYYPYKQQMWWMLAVDGEDSPTLGVKLQVNELRETAGGVRRGWATVTGLLPTCLCMTLLTEILLDENGHNTLSTRPILGYAGGFMLRADQGSQDDTTNYLGKIRTRPFILDGLLSNWGARVGALLAAANPAGYVQVSLIRDFGLETNAVITPLAPQKTESFVIKPLDNLVMVSATAMQFEFGDVTDAARVPGRLYPSR